MHVYDYTPMLLEGKMKKIFIDGRAGTTGLKIYDRLNQRSDIELIVLSEEERKDTESRKRALNQADIAFLCLPDAAAVEAVTLINNPNTVVIDTSTAHRTIEGWAYGFPELSKAHEENIRSSKHIAVPGCHASGFIALVYPLIKADILPMDALLTCHSLTGYSGGGKKMIAAYEFADRDPLLAAPRQYGLTQQHKHLKEMKAITGIETDPLFFPIVSNFYSGMEVTVPLFAQQLKSGAAAEDIKEIYKNQYTNGLVQYCENLDQDGFLSAATLSGKDNMKVAVLGNRDRILLTAIYDNLGKGASGAALECLNIVTGQEKSFGLDI